MKCFSGFSLDPANQCVWRGRKRIQLAPKAYAVLAYLVENADRLVTKEELLDAVWPQTFVQEAVLKSCVLEIRKALGEDSRNPRHIVTLHRRGYRFVSAAPGESGCLTGLPAADTLIGRDADLERLHELLRLASGGERQIVFITGEPGVGKSVLVEHFLRESGRSGPFHLLKGQGIEHLGSREAYYPVFHALTTAAKAEAIADLLPVLRRYAPTWLADMPGLVSSGDTAALRQETLGAGRDRMVRELSEAVETLAAATTLIFVLEDLHWSDVSTLDLISSIASRTGPARLLMIGTYRPIDVILSNHPVKQLKQGLAARGLCVELALPVLEKRHVVELLGVRLHDHDLPPAFVDLVHYRTDGNPLFVINVLEYAASQSLIENVDGRWRMNAGMNAADLQVPDSIFQTIATQMERLAPEEQDVLQAASVAGSRFAVSLLGRGWPDEDLAIEDCCERLARRNLFIRPAGLCEFAAGQFSACYEFTHSLYRDAIHRDLSPARRMRLHRAVAEQLEAAFSGRLREAAAELAEHFQECCEYEKAIRHLRMLAERCATRHALREGLDALNRALTLVEKLPECKRLEVELELIEQIGMLYRLMGQLVLSAEEFEKMYERARAAGDAWAQLRAQHWIASVTSWLDRDRCMKAVDAVVALAAAQPDEDRRLSALGQVSYWNLLFRGWDERDLLASSAAMESVRKGVDRVLLALHATRHAFFLALSSQYRSACETAGEGVRTSTEIENLMDYSVGHYFEAWALLHLGDWGRLQNLLRSSIEMAKRNGHDFWALLFGLLDVFLHVMAFSFEHARDACRGYLVDARRLGHPLSVQTSLVLLGLAECGAGDLGAARRNLEELRDWQSRERILMDWIWNLPLGWGFSELCLAEGNLDSARIEADRFLLSAGATAERTWTALAHSMRARVAIAKGDDATARNDLANGLALIQGVEAPLGAWRLHALAAEVHGDFAHLAKARDVVRNLASALGEDSPLGRSLLTAPPAAAVLSNKLRRNRSAAC